MSVSDIGGHFSDGYIDISTSNFILLVSLSSSLIIALIALYFLRANTLTKSWPVVDSVIDSYDIETKSGRDEDSGEFVYLYIAKFSISYKVDDKEYKRFFTKKYKTHSTAVSHMRQPWPIYFNPKNPEHSKLTVGLKWYTILLLYTSFFPISSLFIMACGWVEMGGTMGGTTYSGQIQLSNSNSILLISTLIIAFILSSYLITYFFFSKRAYK
jgi:hypothetical protein